MAYGVYLTTADSQGNEILQIDSSQAWLGYKGVVGTGATTADDQSVSGYDGSSWQTAHTVFVNRTTSGDGRFNPSTAKMQYSGTNYALTKLAVDLSDPADNYGLKINNSSGGEVFDSRKFNRGFNVTAVFNPGELTGARQGVSGNYITSGNLVYEAPTNSATLANVYVASTLGYYGTNYEMSGFYFRVRGNSAKDQILWDSWYYNGGYGSGQPTTYTYPNMGAVLVGVLI